MQGQTPGLWLLVRLGLATVVGTGVLCLLGMFLAALSAGAGFTAIGVVAFVPGVVVLAAAVCVCAALPCWVVFQAAFRGGLALGITPRAALHPSLAIVTLGASWVTAWGLELFGDEPMFSVAVSGVVPQIALWGAIRLFLDGPSLVGAEQ